MAKAPARAPEATETYTVLGHLRADGERYEPSDDPDNPTTVDLTAKVAKALLKIGVIAGPLPEAPPADPAKAPTKD